MKKEKSKSSRVMAEFLAELIRLGGKTRAHVDTNVALWVVDMPPREKKKPGWLYKIKRFFTPEWKRVPYVSGLVQETYVCQTDEDILVLSKKIDCPTGLAFGTLLPNYSNSLFKDGHVKFFDMWGNEV